MVQITKKDKGAPPRIWLVGLAFGAIVVAALSLGVPGQQGCAGDGAYWDEDLGRMVLPNGASADLSGFYENGVGRAAHLNFDERVDLENIESDLMWAESELFAAPIGLEGEAIDVDEGSVERARERVEQLNARWEAHR